MNFYSASYLRNYNNQYDNQYTPWFSSSLSLCIFYGIFGYMCKKVIDTYYETINLSKPINNYPLYNLKSINDTHNDEYKQKLFSNLLSINSIDRCYILYFIFKRHGNFKCFSYQKNDIDISDTTDSDSKTEQEYNSYELYNKMMEKYNLTQDYINLDEKKDRNKNTNR